jgi:hypothetical protein
VQHVGSCRVTRLMRGDLPITIRTQVEIWAHKVDTGLVHICEDRDTNCKGCSNNMWELSYGKDCPSWSKKRFRLQLPVDIQLIQIMIRTSRF